jgi:hypothetical protein
MSSCPCAELIEHKDSFMRTLHCFQTCYLQIKLLGLQLCYITRFSWKPYFLRALLGGGGLAFEGVDEKCKGSGACSGYE